MAGLDALEIITQTLGLDQTQIVPTDNQMLFIEELQDNNSVSKVIVSMPGVIINGYTHMHIRMCKLPVIWKR